MSWLAPFWNSDVQSLSREARVAYLYLVGSANELGLCDYYIDKFVLDTGYERTDLEVAIQELISSKLVYSFGNQLLVANYLWNRRKNREVVEIAAGIYDDLPTYRKTDLQMIPLRGLEFILNPNLSTISAEEKRLGFDPTQYTNPPLKLNPNWTKP